MVNTLFIIIQGSTAAKQAHEQVHKTNYPLFTKAPLPGLFLNGSVVCDRYSKLQEHTGRNLSGCNQYADYYNSPMARQKRGRSGKICFPANGGNAQFGAIVDIAANDIIFWFMLCQDNI